MTVNASEQEEHAALRALLHDEVDPVPLSGRGWQAISRQLPRRRARRWLPALVAAGAVAAVVAAVAIAPGILDDPGKRTGQVQPAGGVRTPVWPYPDTAAAASGTQDWALDRRATALHFVASLGVAADRLTAADAAGGTPDDVTVTLAASPGPAVLGTVHVAQYGGSPVWGVTGMDSPGLRVRSPRPGARFDPPLSVAFRSDTDADATVRLYESAQPDPVAEWTGAVDAGTDWYANANVVSPARPTPAYVVVFTGSSATEMTSVSVVPVTLGGN